MRVCVLDSGVDADHPDVGGVERSVAVEADDEGYARVVDDDEGDVFGHGTACAGIIRSLAPDVSDLQRARARPGQPRQRRRHAGRAPVGGRTRASTW